MKIHMGLAMLALVAAMGIFAQPAGSQQTSQGQRGFAQLLADFTREHAAARPNLLGAHAAIYEIIARPDRYSRALSDSLLNAFTKLAISSPIPSVRTAAATFISVPGESARSQPARGTVARLTAIYGTTTDDAVRLVILRALSLQAEVTTAIPFLMSIARGGSHRDDDSVLPPMYAVRALSVMGEPGRAALQRLHSEGLVRNPRASAYLDRLIRKGSAPSIPRQLPLPNF